MKISRLVAEDIDRVIPLAKKMHEESVYRTLPFEPDYIRRFAAVAIADKTYCPLVAKIDNGGIVGFFSGQISPSFFGPALIASDHVFFVEPDFRGTSAAHRLLRAFEDWATEMGAAEIFLGITTGVEEDRTASFYASWGFALTGRVMKKGVAANVLQRS